MLVNSLLSSTGLQPFYEVGRLASSVCVAHAMLCSLETNGTHVGEPHSCAHVVQEATSRAMM